MYFFKVSSFTVFACFLSQLQASSDDDDFLAPAAPKANSEVDQQTLDVLSLLYDKIDIDHDEKVTPVELRNWIRYVQRKYVRDGVESAWQDNKHLSNGRLTWNAYVSKRWGSWALMEDTEMEVDSEESKKEKGFNYKLSLSKDRRRWKLADHDGDDELTKEEYADFAFPEDSPKMERTIVDDSMADLDLDGDNRMSIEEFLADYDKNELQRDYETKPSWLEGDKAHFKKHMDRNGDGFVDKDEMAFYMIPNMDHHANLEVKHLFKYADADKSNYLTKEEFLNKAKLMKHSQVTNHGQVIYTHDEF